MLELSQLDRDLYRSLREHGVLRDLEKDKIPAEAVDIYRKMSVVMLCSDGHRFGDIFDYLRNLMDKEDCTSMLHPFADHGLPLWLSSNSPLNIKNRGNNLLESIGEVPSIQGISSGIICPHAPCAAATRYDLNMVDQIKLAKEGKELIVKTFRRYRIACFFHISIDKREKTHYIDGPSWREWFEHYSAVSSSVPLVAV